MRPLIFLFPHNRMDVGGNSAQVRFVDACRRLTSVTTAFYGDRVAGHPHLDDVLAAGIGLGDDAPIFVIHWGPDIAMLLDKLRGRNVIYIAHSTGWGMALPPNVPILCVSRHTMSYWGRHAPNAYLALLPNIVDVTPRSTQFRDIDVLVQSRKSSAYLLDRLVPALREQCQVTLLDGWVDDLGEWFDRSKVYLYDSIEHWIDVGATEGFGLPPLEAMGHGCVVFSSVNDALADYLDPGLNCRKIRVHSLAWDVKAVLKAVEEHAPRVNDPVIFEPYAFDEVSVRLQTLLGDLQNFFGFTAGSQSDLEDLWEMRRPTTLQRAKRAVKVLAGV